ncbi:MAG: DNA internalization-related competence protein ComEC/Rec2 [Chrysiogenia bacterium]
MRDIFTPIFLLALTALALVHGLAPNPFVFTPLALMTFTFFFIFFYFKQYRPAYACIALALVLLAGGSYLRGKIAYESARGLRFPQQQYLTINGTLLAFPEIGNDASVLLLRSSSFSWGGKMIERELNVRVNCRGDCREFNRGDRVEVAARIDPRLPNRNFFPNPYEKYLLYKNIHLTAFSKSAQLLQLTARANIFWRAIGAWRESIRQKIEARYQTDGVLSPPGVFLEATILGDRLRLENDEQEMLIGSGVFHLLAISGANIGMLALISLLVCRWLRFSLKVKYALTALLLLLFLTVSGFDISAQRAVMMALLLFAGRVWFMDVQLSNIISFCGLLLLAFNPAQFLDPGFILTFSLTAALLIGRRILLPLLRFLPRYGAELLTANFATALLALPLSLFFFQRYAFSGFFSGILLVPLAGAITVCGALLLLLVILPFNAAALALLPAGVFLDLFFKVSRWVYEHFSLSIFRPPPPLWLLAVIGLLFFSISLERLKIYWRIALAMMLAGILLFIALPPHPYQPGRLEAYFLDVGHGDAGIVVFPGGDALLIDGGGASLSDFQVGRRLLLPFILQKRIRIRWAAISHYHPDHVKAQIELMAILAPEELWLSSAAAENDLFKHLLAAKPKKTLLRKISRGFAKNIDNCSVTCLAPPRFINSAHTANDHSMVLRVSDGRQIFLFSGDIEKNAEAELTTSLGPNLAAAVMKVPHHGSRTSSTARFLDLVRPQLAVISCPLHGSFGFPHREVIERLKQRNIPWLTTARRGGIMIASTAAGLEIEVSK